MDIDEEEQEQQQQQEEQLAASVSIGATASEDEKLVRLEEEAAAAAAAEPAERSTLSKVASSSGDGDGDGAQLSSVSIGSRSSESNRPARRCTDSRRRCQSRIKELIGKHELKNERLEQREGHLSQRLQMLECTVPAVAVWRARQSSPEALRKLVEVATTTSTTTTSRGCRITPSRHYDCRVREIEAQRKEAHRRAEEARSLWLEREAALQSQRARVELARQQQAERRLRMDQLTAEARKLEKEAGTSEDAKKWLDLVESAASLCSSDLECLGRLECLAEAESCTRRRIAELEAKEQALMQALAQADQLVPADDELQRVKDQADEAEKQLQACQAELARYRQREVELLPSDKEAQAMVELADAEAGREDDLATVRDRATQQPITGQASLESKETWAGVETANKDVDATVECVPACVGHYRSEANKSVLARAEMRDKLAQAGVVLVDKSEATLPNFACGFTCGYPQDDVDEFTACCPPDFICNDVVDSVTGMMDAAPDVEMNRKGEDTAGVSAASRGLSGSELAGRAKDSRARLGPGVSDKEIQHESVRNAESEQSLRDGAMKIPRAEIETCLSIVNDMHKKISATSKFPLVSDDFQKLKNIFASKLGLDSYTLEQGERETDEEVTISSTSLKSSQRMESKSEASASTINTKRSDKRSADEVASTKSTLDKSDSKRDVKSVKSILKSKAPSTIEDKKSLTTQPSRSQNKSLVQASESKKTEKSAGKSKALSAELDNKSQKTIKSDKKSLMESTSKKSAMESNGSKSAQSARKSKTPSVDGSRKSTGQITQRSVGKTQESGSRQSSKSDVKSKTSSYKADDKSILRQSEVKSGSSIREKSDVKSRTSSLKDGKQSDEPQAAAVESASTRGPKGEISATDKTSILGSETLTSDTRGDSLSSDNPEKKEVARDDRGSASSKTGSEEAEKKSLDQPSSARSDGKRESDVRQDSKVPETEVRSIELEESRPSGSRSIEASESPRAEPEEGDVPETMGTLQDGPLAAVEAEMAAAALDFTIEFSAEVRLEQQQQQPKLIGPAEEKVEPLLQGLGEEAPKDKPDLSRQQSAAVEATTDKGPDDKTDDDLCICEPLARIMQRQSKWQERQQPPVLSKLACGCPFERRARQEHRSAEERVTRRRTICQPAPRRHQRYPKAPDCQCCYRCGAPLRRAATERRIDECQERRDDGPLTSEVPSSESKREKGVLAKLPKAPSSSKRKKPKKRRGAFELLFDGASRKAARILEAISSGELIGLSAKPKLGSSCTCLKNQCRCSESD